MHRQLFQDVYSWAGNPRSIDISKQQTRFCKFDRIEPEAKKIFKKLSEEKWLEGKRRSELVRFVAEYYGEINMLHPFREGNGRALRLLFEHLIINAGFEISWDPVSEEEWLAANIAAVDCDYSGLENIFEKCIGVLFQIDT